MENFAPGRLIEALPDIRTAGPAFCSRRCGITSLFVIVSVPFRATARLSGFIDPG